MVVTIRATQGVSFPAVSQALAAVVARVHSEFCVTSVDKSDNTMLWLSSAAATPAAETFLVRADLDSHLGSVPCTQSQQNILLRRVACYDWMAAISVNGLLSAHVPHTMHSGSKWCADPPGRSRKPLVNTDTLAI